MYSKELILYMYALHKNWYYHKLDTITWLTYLKMYLYLQINVEKKENSVCTFWKVHGKIHSAKKVPVWRFLI